MATFSRLSPKELAAQLEQGGIELIDVREPDEFAAGHISGSRNLPLAQLAAVPLPDGPVVLVCQSGNRSGNAVAQLSRAGAHGDLSDLEGGLIAWNQAGFTLERRAGAPLPLMRQVQIAAGSLVLLGVILSQTLAGGWIWLSGFVGAGLVFAGISGWCGMARLLAVLPWNRQVG
jgi:rhodanese-related sulfurtransferase